MNTLDISGRKNAVQSQDDFAQLSNFRTNENDPLLYEDCGGFSDSTAEIQPSNIEQANSGGSRRGAGSVQRTDDWQSSHDIHPSSSVNGHLCIGAQIAAAQEDLHQDQRDLWQQSARELAAESQASQKKRVTFKAKSSHSQPQPHSEESPIGSERKLSFVSTKKPIDESLYFSEFQNSYSRTGGHSAQANNLAV